MSAISVLLADDHPVLRRGIRTILEMEDDIRVVAETGDGEETIQRVLELKPDVLVLDVSMPKTNGVEVIKALSASYEPVKVLVLSAYDDENFITEMVEAGAAGYLLKREATEAIVEAVRGVAAGETGWFSRAIISKMLAAQKVSRDISFTDREKEILHYLALGWTNTKIGETLGISERTVRYHLRNIYDKVGADSRGMAIAWAVRHGYGQKIAT
jgi:DNA-binding NarL/FixJ family response regulator